MVLPALKKLFARSFSRSCLFNSARHIASFRPEMEVLEDRSLPSTFTVTDLGDTGAGSGLEGDLRYAVRTANANAEPSNQIVFAPGLAGTVTLTQGVLAINKDLEIDGPGQDVVAISGNQQDGVLAITADPRVQVVNLSGLTIRDGIGIIAGGHNVGGGIFNDHAALTLTACTVTGNTVGDLGQGGGIFNTGTLIVNSSTVSDNAAGGNGLGGGIYNYHATLAVDSSTISGNAAGDFGQGGGIFSEAELGPITISSSTIADDHVGVAGYGGGLYIAAHGLVPRPITITDSTISGNSTGSGNTTGNQGGGLSFLGALRPSSLTIRRSAIVGNTANVGGGLETFQGDVTIDHTTVSGNTARAGSGGGIETISRTTITDSLMSDNRSASFGGGIDNGQILTLSSSTIAGNTSDHAGGGLYDALGDANVVNSTFSGNTAGTFGGGIGKQSATLELTSVTITGNSANGDVGNPGHGGGGLQSSRGGITEGGPVVLRNTLVAGNFTSSTGPDVVGPVLSLGFNLIGMADDSEGWGTHDLTGDSSAPIDPLLGPLQDNGGPTPTHALLAGSPAIRRGDPNLRDSLDQRGTIRSHGGVIDPPVDVGAFEPAEFTFDYRVVAPAEVTAGQPFTVTVTALDFSGNTVSTFLGAIQLSSTDPRAALPGDYTYVPADGGVATFTVTLQTTGNQVIQVNDINGRFNNTTVTVDPAGGAARAPATGLADLVFGDADATGLGWSLPFAVRKHERGL